MADEQMPLFPQRGAKGQYGPPVTQIKAINADSSLASAASAYHDHMVRQGFSEHTIKAFAGDKAYFKLIPIKPNHQILDRSLYLSSTIMTSNLFLANVC